MFVQVPAGVGPNMWAQALESELPHDCFYTLGGPSCDCPFAMSPTIWGSLYWDP